MGRSRPRLVTEPGSLDLRGSYSNSNFGEFLAIFENYLFQNDPQEVDKLGVCNTVWDFFWGFKTVLADCRALWAVFRALPTLFEII